MERFIIKGHFVPKEGAIEKGHKEHDWFYGKAGTTLLEGADFGHPETGHLTTNPYYIKEYGYSRKCDAVRAMNFLKRITTDSKWWSKEYEVISVTV